MNSTKSEPQLFSQHDPGWRLRPIYARPEAGEDPELAHFEVWFGARRIMRLPISGEARGRKICLLLNSSNAVPRDRIECFADAPNPDEYRRKLLTGQRRRR